MEQTTVNDDIIVLEEATTEQHLDSHHKQRENVTRNQTDLERSDKLTQLGTRSSIDRKNLTDTEFIEYSRSSIHPTAKGICAFVIFTSLSMITGILIVYFTSPKPRGPKCEFQLRPTVPYSTRDSSHPHSLAIGDFNNDKHMDLVVANFGSDSVTTLLGYGDNSFANQTTYSMGIGSAPRMVAVGYFNNDTRLDIVIANFYINTIVILFGNGNGSFANPTMIDISPSHPLYMTVDDFNNDGCFDIAFVGVGTDYIGIILGFGNGTFGTPVYFATGYDSHSSSIAVGDFNGDQQKDLIVANYGTDNLGVFFGYGNGTFTHQTTFTTGVNSGPYSIAIFDLNNDTHLDLAVVYSDMNKIAIFLGYGNETFICFGSYLTGSNSNPVSIVIADFNNDNKSDITVVNNASDTILLLFGNGDGTFANPNSYSTGPRSSPYSIGVGDFNSDNQLDVAIANRENNNVKIFNSFSQQKFAKGMAFLTADTVRVFAMAPILADTSSNQRSLIIDNTNNDNQSDTIVVNDCTNNVSVPLQYDNTDSSRQTVNSTTTHSSPIFSVANDFNGDDRLNIFIPRQSAFQSRSSSFATSVCSMVATTGDFNRDGKPDLAVANYATNSVGILLGHGNGSFASPILLSTGDASNPISVTVGDFNNDGWLDVAVANSGTDNIGIFLAYGNGQFTPQATYRIDYTYMPISLAVDDLDKDGALDISVVYYHSDNVAVFFGSGDGEFSGETIHYIGYGAQPSSVAIADFNNDGRLDIAVTIIQWDTVDVLLGWGNRTFQSRRTFSTGAYSKPGSLAVGDFNRDGNIDIVVGNFQPQEEHILIFLGNGHGNFSTYGKYLAQTNSMLCSVAIGKLSNDTLLDVVVVNIDTQQIGVFLGHGDGTFTSQISYFTNNIQKPISISIGDFNNDTLIDLAVADYRTPVVDILLGFIDTSFVDRTTYFIGAAAFPQAVVLGDFTNNGQLDVVVGNDGTHDITILLNGGNGKFTAQTAYSGDSTFYPSSIAVSDFNDDQQLDITVANSVVNTVTLLHGQRNGTFGSSKVFSTGSNSSPQSLAVADFNKDNKPDIVVAHSGTGSVGLLLKMDNGAIKHFETLSAGSGSKPHGLAIGDFDNDGRSDIAVTNNGKASVGIFFGLGEGTFTEQKTVSLGEGVFPIWVSCGDFNNDKKMDIVVSCNVRPVSVVVLLGNSDRSFQIKHSSIYWAAEMNGVGDFNNDTLLDVVICHPYNSVVTVLLGSGDGTFQYPESYRMYGSYPVAVAVDDLNKDGRLDIIVVYKEDLSIAVYFGYGDGTFSDETVYPTNGYGAPFSITTGDFNNDGWNDLVVGMYQAKCIGILFSYANGTFSPFIPYVMEDVSLHHSISAVDFNKDGQLDIIITETNNDKLGIILGHVNGSFFNEITYHTGNNSYPYSVGLGDFNNDSRLDIAAASMLSDDIGIFLGYANEDFASTVPKPIGSLSKPVSIAVGDFNNDTCLDIVVADRAANQILIIQGSGYGTFLSQQSFSTNSGSFPTWVAVEDFNQDQHLDIAVVNSGTNDIGVFLGYGNGSFSSVLISSTFNIYLPVSLCVGHFDNDTYLDVAVASSGNNNVCILFGYGDGRFGNALCRTSGYDSRPYAVASGDMNGDNLTDVVIANKGSSIVEILTKICEYP